LSAYVNPKRGGGADNPLGTERIGRLMLRFAIPAIVSMLVNALYNLIDQVLIGFTVGMLGIAATNIAFPLTTISTATALLLGIGGASNYNLRLGEGDIEASKRVAGNTLSYLAIAGTAIGAVVLIFTNSLVTAFGSTETVKPLAMSYTFIIAIGVPFGIFTTGACALIRADGSPRFAMVCTLVGAVFNLVVDPIIAFVLRWGLVGLAWSTTIGQIMTAGIAVYYFLAKANNISINRKYITPKPNLLKVICALGISSCINQVAMAIIQITMNNTLRHYGAMSMYGSDIPLGSVGAIAKLNVVFVSFTVGIAQGCQPIHGFNFGAKRYDRVKKTLRLALTAATAVSILVFCAFQLFPRQLMAIFGENDPLYLQFAERYLRIYMFMTFINGVQPITANFFTSIGRAKRGMWVSLTRQILFLLPMLLILPLFFGLDGVMYAGPAADLWAAGLSATLITLEMKRINALQQAQSQLTV